MVSGKGAHLPLMPSVPALDVIQKNPTLLSKDSRARLNTSQPVFKGLKL